MVKFVGIVIGCLLVLVLLGKCMQDEQAPEYNPNLDDLQFDEATSKPATPALEKGFAISSPSDPGASYRILKIEPHYPLDPP